MSKRNFLVIFIPLIFVGSYIFAQQFFRGPTLSSKEVLKKWGQVNIDFEKFRTADYKIKAKMAYAIMTNKTLIGMKTTQIRELFGDPDGFYFLDTYPAYIIQDGKDRTEETWQIVFLLNSKRQVRDIIVHKNCCDK